MKPKTIIAAALIGYCALSFGGAKLPDLSGMFPKKTEPVVDTRPVISEPSDAVKQTLKPILELAKDDPAYRKALSEYFITFGMAIKDDVIKTNNPATLRTVNSAAGALYAKRMGIAGKHSGANDVINATLSALLGTSGEAITPEKKASIGDVFIHIGWAFGQ